MSPRWSIVWVTVVLIAAAVPASAQRTFLRTYSQLQLDGATATNGIAADQTNRVWVATNFGVAVLIGDQLEFSLNINDFVGGSANVRDVDFGELTDGENFFLSFLDHIEYGRALADRTVSINSTVLPVEAPTNPLASDVVSSLWAGTGSGLVEFSLGGGQPDRENRTFRQGEVIPVAEVAPWLNEVDGEIFADPAVAFFSAETQRLYLARSANQNETRLAQAPNLEDVVGIDFESDDPADPTDGDLWAADEDTISNYPGEVLKSSVPQDAQPQSFGFGISLRTIADIAVDPFTNTIWLATDQGAYFQTPVNDTLASGDCTNEDETCRGWRQASFTATDEIFVVFADPAGNMWFGTDRGVRGLVVRLLALNASRYLGDGATPRVSLEDLAEFGDNGVPAETAEVEVTVGGTTKTLQSTEEGDTGQFTFSFRITTGSASEDEPVFSVSSSADDVPILVVYTFPDARGDEQFLTATATWANIVEFDDDLWLGDLCFIEALRR